MKKQRYSFQQCCLLCRTELEGRMFADGHREGGRRAREYMTRLFGRRSVIALCCGILTLILSFYGMIAGVLRETDQGVVCGFSAFMYFTMIANLMAAVSAAFVIPCAVEGIRRKRFIVPGWVAVAQYISTCSIGIVMAFVLVVVSWTNPKEAFGGPNLYLHVFCPVLILIAFFQMENEYILTGRDWLIGCIPFTVYACVYFIEVALIGEARGGWPDLYHVTECLSPALAYPLMILLGVGVCSLIAVFFNFITKKRTEKTYRFWTGDTDPIEARIEAYGLGRMAGLKGEKGSLQVPLDLLGHLAEKCKLDMGTLIRPYITGYLNGLREKDDRKETGGKENRPAGNGS